METFSKTGLSSLSLKAFTFKKEEPKKVSLKSDEIKRVDKTIIGYYKEDVNIIGLNSLILEILKEEKEERLQYLKKVSEEEKINLTKAQSLLDRKYSIAKLSSSIKEIKTLQDDTKIISYSSLVNPFLLAYNKIGPLKKVRIIGRGESKIEENNDVYIRRHTIIEEFISHACKYVNINLIRKSDEFEVGIIICDNCYTALNTEEYTGDTSIVCPKCSVEMPKVVRFTEDVIASVDTKLKSSEYQDLGNFEDAINKYMGLSHHSSLDITDLTKKLDKYFHENTLMLGSDVKLNYKANQTKYNRKLMKCALKHIGYNHLYSDMQYIMNIYWGKPLKDVCNLKEQLIKDYRLSQPLYDKYKNLEKSSSMNVQYRLWKHLRRLDHECDKASDFNIPIASFEYYETIWSKICTDLGWENKS